MLYCYFWIIFIPINCSFKTLFQLMQSFCIILSWWSYNWNIKFCISYCKCWFLIISRIIYYNILQSVQVRIRLISQLINGILKVPQKLLKYFNGTIILTFSLPLFPILPVIFGLNSNEALLILPAGKSTIAALAFKYGSSL